MSDFPFQEKFNNKRVRLAFKEDIEPHEILLDSLAEKKERDFGFSEKKLEVPLLAKIIQGFFIFCFLIIFFLLLKTFQFQIIEGKNFVQMSERNKFIVRQIQAERGVIYDKNMEQLVFNKSNFDLVCEDKVVGNLSHQELIFFEAKIMIGDLSGCQIVKNVVREYKEGETFSHIIGYTGRIKEEEFAANSEIYLISDYIGRTGVENYYERYLRKNPGRTRIERDAFGNIISEENISLPESGKSLVLWLDAALQRKAKEALENKYKEIGAKGGIVVAMDPKTGGILSLVSLPGFDNNLFQKGADQEALQNLLKDPQKENALFNRAISGGYVTGSTIKPLIALAALEENIISPEKQIYGSAYLEVPHRYNPEITFRYGDWTVHGWVDMKKAIAQSCNIYFYTIGGGYKDQKGLGPTKIKEYLELFGWGEKTGIDLPNEISSFIPSTEWKAQTIGEGWWDGDTYYLSIGQGYLHITPLAVTAAFGAIANGGTLYQPKVVKEIVGEKTINSEVVRYGFIDHQNLQVVRDGMRQTVTGENSPQASAVILNSLPVTSAAKTGTAELGNDRYHNWITVFAPYEDPEIVLTVMIENVKGVQAAVLPVAREILEWYFAER